MRGLRRIRVANSCWGIFRESTHSPGRESDDTEILRLTAYRGLIVINGNKDDKKIVLPKLIAESGAGSRMFELRLTTSELNDRRQGALVAAGEREIVQGNTINVYRT